MTISHWLGVVVLLLFVGTSVAADDGVSEQLTHLKSQALSAQRDFGLLKRELAHSPEQLLVYLSVDIDTRFELVEATLTINERAFKRHHFDEMELGALQKGGNQLFLNTKLPSGNHRVTIEVTAKDQHQKVFKQEQSVDLKKSESTKIVSVHLLDNLSAQRYRFGINEWND